MRGQMVRQILRAEVRRGAVWRGRVALAGLAAGGAFWAAVAPQAAFGWGDRLRLGFECWFGVLVLWAATAGWRAQPVEWNSLASSAWVGDVFKGGLELAAAAPVALFLAGVQAVSFQEIWRGAAGVGAALGASVLIRQFGRWQIGVWFVLAGGCAWALLARGRNWFEAAMAGLFLAHLGVKAWMTWSAVALGSAERHNLMHEAVTALSNQEMCARRRSWLRRRFAWPLGGLAAANLLVLGALAAGVSFPVTLEVKTALAMTLGLGTVLLFLDASALAWRGILGGLTTTHPARTFAGIFAALIGVPWAAAWAFSALHTSEAFTLNEAAAYFFLWAVVGGAVSWMAGGSARDRLHRDLRRLLSEP